MVEKLLKELEMGAKPKKTASKLDIKKEESPKLDINISAKPNKDDDVKEVTFKFHPRKIERIAYLMIIVLLIGFIGYDRIFLHKIQKNPDTTANVVKEPEKADNQSAVKIEEEKEEKKEEKTEPMPVEEPKVQLSGLSGKIEIKIITIDKEKASNDIWYIKSVAFTIENGKDDIFFPHVSVSAYDSSWDEEWQTKSRGVYTFPSGIKPGEKQTGAISLVPKSFSKPNLKKTVILFLRNATEDGKIITTARSDFMIE